VCAKNPTKVGGGGAKTVTYTGELYIRDSMKKRPGKFGEIGERGFGGKNPRAWDPNRRGIPIQTEIS